MRQVDATVIHNIAIPCRLNLIVFTSGNSRCAEYVPHNIPAIGRLELQAKRSNGWFIGGTDITGSQM